jgi:hypothetical protein
MQAWALLPTAKAHLEQCERLVRRFVTAVAGGAACACEYQ